MELFSYLKKHTPYYNQFYDFGQFETLIRVLVIKDLGRIYKALNHSFNFDTAEGKALFLYMEKDSGEDPETSYESFNEICNPKSRIEAAPKMREVIENLMKSFYEYGITLWTDTDFIIHCFLKEVDNKMAKRYMELMHQFASVVTGENEPTSDSSANSVLDSSTIDDFFPLFGITLGETTWEQVENMGYKVEIYKEGPARKVRVNNVTFWDYDGEGVFTSILWLYNSFNITNFPPLWQSKGFSWELSYNEWIAVFKKLGFIITVIKEPSQRECSGRNVLSAKFEALSPNESLLFTMNFDWGENGCQTSSPKSLYAIDVEYKGPISAGTNQVNSDTSEKASIMKNQDDECYDVVHMGEKPVSRSDNSNHTKSITLKRPFSLQGVPIAEVLKLRNLFNELMQHRSVSCYAQKQNGSINVYLEDGTLFHTVVDSVENEMLNRILQNEKLLYGEISGHSKMNTDKHLLIKLYYDYISGNHDDLDIAILWMRDFAAQLHGVAVPKAKYVGKGSKADNLDKKSVSIDFPCYEDDGYDSFDFSKLNATHEELNGEIIRLTDLHQEDLHHNTPFVVLARQNPALPSLYEMCLPDGSMFGIIGNEGYENGILRKWIAEIGIVPVTVQSYERSISGLLTLNCRAFKKKCRNENVVDFISAHYIDDIVDIEIEDNAYQKIVKIIDPLRDHSMTEILNVVAMIPNWASQAGYYIVKDDEHIWLAPSFNADILDQVHLNKSAQGRVISYRDNHDGTYHFELKFHIEK